MPLTRFKLASCVLFLICASSVAADPDPGWWSYFGTGPGNYGLTAAGRDAVVFDGHLIVGGSFEKCWNDQVLYDLRYIGRFNGSSWGRIADGFNSWVRAVHVYGDDLYAGGDFTAAGLTPANHIARWDGWSWNAVGNPGQVVALATYGNDLIAGVINSPAGVVKWDGQAWSWLGLGLGPGSSVRSMAEYAGDLYVGGYINSAEGVPVTHIVRWDGQSWSDFGTVLTEGPFSWGIYPVDVLSTEYDGTLLVGGYFSHVNGIYANGLARWDGETWTGLGEGLGPAAAVADITVYNGELVVVGGIGLPGGGSSIARWDGSSWQPFGTGVSIGPFSADLSVQPFDGDLYVTGSFLQAGGKFSSNIARWREIGTWAPIVASDAHTSRLWISSANPTSSGADIGFTLPVASRIDLSIFDLAGRRMATLATGMGNSGTSQVRWTGRDGSGESASSGVYFVRLESPNHSLTQKLVVRR